MFKKLKKLTIIVSLLLSISPFAFSAVAYGAPVDDACSGLRAAGATCGSGNSGFSNVVTTVINVLSVIVGVVAVIMIIIGGLRYIVSNGDSNGVQGAKNTILYAIVGLVIVLFAQIIVAFVLDRATAQPAPQTTSRLQRT